MRNTTQAALEILDQDDSRSFYLRERTTDLCSIEVKTLFQWCMDYMDGDMQGQLIENDAAESKDYQRLLVLDCLEEEFDDSWSLYRDACSAELRDLIENCRTEEWFAVLLQHEIACVIKGNRILSHHQQRYLQLDRPRRGMPITADADRLFIFGVYKRYETQLQELGVFDTDDIIMTVLGRLESPVWSRVRQRDGYDIVFVDEAHVFNENERALIHALTRDAHSLPRLVLALDILQSIGDRGLEEDNQGRLIVPTLSQAAEWQQDGFVNSERQALSLMFRCAEPILDLAHAIVASSVSVFDLKPSGVINDYFPNLYQSEGTSPLPQLVFAAGTMQQAERAFEIADAWRKLEGWTRSGICIICFSSQVFDAILELAQERRKPLVTLERRGNTEGVTRAEQSGSFLLSRPEFTAGLQFKGVIMVDLSKGTVPQTTNAGDDAQAAMRHRSISELYLSVTRAESRVCVIADEQRGMSDLLTGALEGGYLVAPS